MGLAEGWHYEWEPRDHRHMIWWPRKRLFVVRSPDNYVASTTIPTLSPPGQLSAILDLLSKPVPDCDDADLPGGVQIRDGVISFLPEAYKPGGAIEDLSVRPTWAPDRIE